MSALAPRLMKKQSKTTKWRRWGEGGCALIQLSQFPHDRLCDRGRDGERRSTGRSWRWQRDSSSRESGGECVRDRCDREIKRDSCGSRIAEEDDEEKASPPSLNFLFGKQPMEFMDILMFRTFHSFFMSSTVSGKVNYTTSPSDTRKTEVFLAAWRIERPWRCTIEPFSHSRTI